MGHYASEMGCPRCGQTGIWCHCPPPPRKPQWAVNRDFVAVDVTMEPHGYLSAYMLGRGIGGRWIYNTREEAEDTIPALIKDKIAQHEADIVRLSLQLEVIETGLERL